MDRPTDCALRPRPLTGSILVFVALMGGPMSACTFDDGGEAKSGATDDGDVGTSHTGSSNAGSADGASAGDDAQPLPRVREIKVLYTNDEHGWMEGQDPGGAAANLVALWEAVEDYDPDGDFVVLSGGDMWTGPAVSTFFEGESMVEVMNAMGYDAAALGNHEFDFGLDVLTQRAAEMSFPLLSANTRAKSDGQVPTQYGFVPWQVLDVRGVQVGVIGLTTRSTPTTTLPDNVAGFDFIDYETALREAVPAARAAGAELVFVPGHVCMYELEPLADAVADLDIDLIGGGHCNELVAQERNGIVMLEGGSHFATYAWASFTYDTETQEVLGVKFGTEYNEGGARDAGIDAIVAKWASAASEELDRVIGYVDHEIVQRGAEQQRLVTRPVLEAYADVDLYITNSGGLRAPIPPGEITVGDVIAVMPFDNTLIRVELTGAQLEDVVQAGGGPVIGGGYATGGTVVLDATGGPVVAGQTYTVMVNSFMYQGGDNYGGIKVYDPDGVDTGINTRDPVISWIEAQNSSPSNPLNP